MFNVYISADIEGVNGVVYPHQTSVTGGESYYSAVGQMHDELNSIVEALIDQDVDKITINDAHGSMENLSMGDLEPKIELITGKPKPISMLAGLDDSYTCVFFVGYHSKAGSEGVLAHTFSSIFNEVRLNNEPIGEIELNAAYAGLINVPVALLTGDNVACSEALRTIGDVKTVCTKTAISYSSAKCKPNEELFVELKTATTETVKNPQDWIIYRKNPPYNLELDFADRRHADIAELLPGIKRLSASRIGYTSESYQEIYKLLQFFSMTLAKS